MNKIKRSGKLLRAAFAVLFREKKLLLFPLIATGLAMVAALFFLAPIVLYPTGHSYFSAAHWSALAGKFSQAFQPAHGVPVVITKTSAIMFFSNHWWAAPLFAVAYFVSMFLATFSNVAFYHEIMQALNGQTISIRRGFRFAAARWRAILLWSLFAGLVGYIINAIEERVGFLGRVITGFIGTAWSVACVFIIPTLVRDTETTSPFRLLRNSVGTLKRSWGELVIGFVGLELAGAILMLALVLAMFGVGTGAFYVGVHFHLHTLWLVFVAVGGLFAVVMSLSWISSVVNPVYRCALYIYATEGVVPGTFDKELLDSAWKVK
jgi:hypothetical protein